MKLTIEKKFFTVCLIFYWVGLFTITHIPVPMWVRKMGVSDKTMHFAAYMVLTLLLWLAGNFDIKVNWRKIRPWLVLGIILLYSLADEFIQYFAAGRSADILDITSDIAGAAAAMLTVTFISGYHAAMILVVICPIFLPAIVKSKLVKQDSIIEEVLYLAGFAIITIAWTKYLTLVHRLNLKKYAYLFFLCPAASISIIEIYAVLTNKPFDLVSISICIAAILLTQFILRATNKKSVI